MRDYFILVCLLHLCRLSISQECIRELLENMVFYGDVIQLLYSPDAEHCQQLCTQHHSCISFTFVRADSPDENSHFHCNLISSLRMWPLREQGVTSGFSLKPCDKDKTCYLSQVYHGVDFSGPAYQSLFTEDYQECQRVCTNDPTCQFFTFLRYECHLKFSWTVPRMIKVEANAGLLSGFSHNVQMTQHSDTACETTLFPNQDTEGDDMGKMPAASPEHCQAFCSAHPKCTYFSYASHICYLKRNLDKMVLKAHYGVTSGIPARFCQPDNSWVKKTHANVDFWGSDLPAVFTEDAEACQKICTKDHNCQFYTYVTEHPSHQPNMWNLCYLKRAITMPAPQRVTKMALSVSGFSLRNCQLFMECASSGKSIYVLK